jgi:hypothetical protein
VLLGQPDAVAINVDELQKRLDRLDYAAVARSLSDVGLHSAVEVLATYAGRSSDMRRWLEDAQINNDMNQRLEFLAGLGVELDVLQEGLSRDVELPQISRWSARWRRGADQCVENASGTEPVISN